MILSSELLLSLHTFPSHISLYLHSSFGDLLHFYTSLRFLFCNQLWKKRKIHILSAPDIYACMCLLMKETEIQSFFHLLAWCWSLKHNLRIYFGFLFSRKGESDPQISNFWYLIFYGFCSVSLYCYPSQYCNSENIEASVNDEIPSDQEASFFLPIYVFFIFISRCFGFFASYLFIFIYYLFFHVVQFYNFIL